MAVYFHWTSLPKSEECGVASRFTVRVTPQKNVRPDEAVASTDDDGRLSLIVQLPIEKTCRFEPCRVAKLEPNTTYVAQLQSVGQSGRQSAWSTLTFTTPDLSRRGDAIEVEAEGDFRPDATHAVEAAFSRVPCVPKQLETAMVSATSAQLTWLVPIRSSTCGAASTYTVEYARYDDDELIPNSHDTNMLAKKKSATILRNAQWFFLNFGQNRSHEHRAPVGTADYKVSYVLDNLHADSNYVARIESYNAQGKSPHYSPVVYFSTLRVDAPLEAGEIVSQTRQRRRHPSSRTTTTHTTTAKSTTHGHHHHTSASTTRHPPPHTRPQHTDDDDDDDDDDDYDDEDTDNDDDDNSSDEHPARTGIIVAGVGMGIGLLVCFVVVARRGVRYLRKRGAAQLP